MNLAQKLNYIYNYLGEPDRNRFSIALLKDLLYEAELIIAKKTECIMKTDETITAVANQRSYPLPSDLLDFKIEKIYFADSSDTNDKKELKKIDIETLNAWDSGWMIRTGTPSNWYIDFENNKYCFYPYSPSISGANRIKIVYKSKPTKMTHFYETGTIGVANAGTAVTGSSTAFIGNVFKDDEFGIGKLLDSTRTYSFPVTWYTVSVDPTLDTALTLSSAYAGSTIASGGYYITSSNSSITNDEINICSCLYVIGICKVIDKEYELGEQLKEIALNRALSEQRRFENVGGRCQFQVPLGGRPSQLNSSLYDYGER